MQNKHIEGQINNILLSIEAFLQSLEIAAMRDDGIISKEEKRTIEKIRRISSKYVDALEKIKNQ